MDVVRYFIQKTSYGSLCKYTKSTLVSKEMKTVFQCGREAKILDKNYLFRENAFFTKVVVPLVHELNRISADTQYLKNLNRAGSHDIL